MKRFTMNLLKLGLTSLVALAASVAHADVPEYVRVRNITYAGTGCPAGSVADNVSPDLQALTLLFDEYFAEVGPGVPYNQRRKNCQILIDLDFPQGWTYTLFTVDYRGYVSLDPDVSAFQQSSYYFAGQQQTARLATRMYGPLDSNFQIRDTLTINSLVWAPCGAQRALNINTEVRADNTRNPNGHGLITTDSIDATLKQIYGLRWERCR